jgi:hypothetical protein
MFDVAWSEIIVVVLVSVFTLDIKDISKIIKFIRNVAGYCNSCLKELQEFILEVEKEGKKITDLQGNEYETYDIDDITPDLKKSDQKNAE